MGRLQKKLSLQRAIFQEGFNGNLEQVARRTFAKLISAADRKVDTGLFTFEVYATIEDAFNEGGVFVRVFVVEQGGTGVINLETTDSDKVIEEFTHPDNRDFLREQVIFLIFGNEIIACNSGNKTGSLISGLLDLGKRAEVVGVDARVGVVDVPDRSTIAQMTQIGVKRVEFSLSSFLTDLPSDSFSGSRAQVLKSIFSLPKANRSEIARRANTIGRIFLSRGRFKSSEVKRDEWLTTIAAQAVADPEIETYNIILEDDSRISNDRLRKTKKIDVRRQANSYNYTHAKFAMSDYYRALVQEQYIGKE